MDDKIREAILHSLQDGKEKDEIALFQNVYQLLETGQLNPRPSLAILEDEHFVHARRLPGGMSYYRLTSEGRKLFWSSREKIIDFLSHNWLLLISTIAAVIAAITGIVSIVLSWNKT